MSGDTTRNFSRHEFACRDGCGLCDPHPLLVCGWQAMVDLAQVHEARSVHATISGPGRCAAHNAAEGGAPGSRHVPDPRTGYTRAADGYLWVRTTDGRREHRLPLRLQLHLAESIPQFAAGGIGVYCDARGPRLHLDVDRPAPARWAKTDDGYVEVEDALQAAREWERRQGAPWGGGPEHEEGSPT